jgi:hypothetical protein
MKMGVLSSDGPGFGLWLYDDISGGKGEACVDCVCVEVETEEAKG